MPVQQPIFIKGPDMSAQFDLAGRRVTAPMTQLGRFGLPGGGVRYARTYATALLNGTQGPITRQLLLAFNQGQVAQQAMRAAQEELERRVKALVESTPHSGLLTIVDIAGLLAVSRSAVEEWRYSHILTNRRPQANSPILIHPDEVLQRCQWVLPIS